MTKNNTKYINLLSLLLTILLFSFLAISCPQNENLLNYEALYQNVLINGKEISKSTRDNAIKRLKSAFRREDENLNEFLRSFVVDGLSETYDNDKWEFESTIFVEFDGKNNFYRKDVWQGEIGVSYEEYNATNGKWTEYKQYNSTTKWEKDEHFSNSNSDLFSSVFDAEIKDSDKGENNLYTILYDGENKATFAFDENNLIYLCIEFSGTTTYRYVFYFRDWGKNIKIDLPKV